MSEGLVISGVNIFPQLASQPLKKLRCNFTTNYTVNKWEKESRKKNKKSGGNWKYNNISAVHFLNIYLTQQTL